MRLRDEGLSWRRSGSEIVVLDLTQSEYFALNDTAAGLWESLAGQDRTAAELIEGLRQRHGIARDRAEADVTEFVDTLTRHGLVDR
jgi:Coenzyme PQQ synthesis protein D (PqqD)